MLTLPTPAGRAALAPVVAATAPFDPASLPGCVADLPAAGARSVVGTDFAQTFTTSGTDYLQAADAARLRPSATTGYTIVFWYKDGGTHSGLANRENSWRIDNGSGLIRYIQWHSGGLTTVDLNSDIPASGQWTMVAFGADPPNAVAFARRDRHARRTGAMSGTPTPGTANLQLGKSATGGVVGSFAHVGIWQRPLTDAELDRLFLANMNGAGLSFASLTGSLLDASEWWDLTESSGNCVGSVGATALVRNGTVARGSGPAAARPTVTGTALDWWLSNVSGGDLDAVGSARHTFVAAADSLTGRPAVRAADSATAVMKQSMLTFNSRDHTIAAVGRSLYRDSIHETVRLGTTGSGNYSYLRDYGEKPAHYAGGSTFNGGLQPPNSWFRTRSADVRVVSSSASGVVARYNSSQLTGTNPTAGTALGLSVGAETYGPAEDLERVCVYSAGLSAASMAKLEGGLRSACPLPALSSTQPVVLFDGNSIPYGIGTSALANAIPTVAMAALGLLYGSRWLDFSIPGLQTTELTAAVAQLAPYRNDARPTVVCMSEITNSLYLYGHSAAVAYQELKDYVAAVRAYLPTAVIVLTTCLPRGVSYTARNAVNASLLTAFPTATAYPNVFLPTDAAFTNCVLAHWAGEATMGPDGAQNSATYYDASNIHPNDTGAALLAPITANSLRVAGVS